MATLHSSTPPPPSSIHTPNTPRFGFGDDYQPYSPRKSARVSQRARSTHTPPPKPSRLFANTPRTSKKRASTDSSGISSSPSSPQTASKKKSPRYQAIMAGRRVSGALSEESTASAAAALGLPQRKAEAHRATAVIRNNGMLPTPDKTPKKAPTEFAPAITSMARTLFHPRPETVDEVMPSPKKKSRKKYSGFTLDSFESEDTPIQIFTDSHEKVPEVDESEDNPFYGPGSVAPPEPTKRFSKRRNICIPGEEDQTLEEIEKRDDGLIYVFRGKKMFRKFVEDDLPDVEQDEDVSNDAGIGGELPSRLRGPKTRSSLKPRLLFPPAQQARICGTTSHNTEDEEADTDIEEPAKEDSTPLDQLDDMTATPKAPKFAPASPPTTSRATRSKKIDMSSPLCAPFSDDETHTPKHQGARASNGSPFDEWQRAKRSEGTVSGAGRKRQGAPIMKGGEKKSRH